MSLLVFQVMNQFCPFDNGSERYTSYIDRKFFQEFKKTVLKDQKNYLWRKNSKIREFAFEMILPWILLQKRVKLLFLKKGYILWLAYWKNVYWISISLVLGQEMREELRKLVFRENLYFTFSEYGSRYFSKWLGASFFTKNFPSSIVLEIFLQTILDFKAKKKKKKWTKNILTLFQIKN